MKKFNEKFKINEFKIRELEYWIISLRPKQITLGSLVLSLKRECAYLSDLTSNESEELHKAFNEISEIYKKSFYPDKINYLALMMVDNQVHFHVIPRYKTSVEFNGEEYKDAFWPKPPSLSESLNLKESVFKDLLDKLRGI